MNRLNHTLLRFITYGFAALAVLVCLLLLAYPKVLPAKLNEWKLISHEEQITELYIQYEDLPQQVVDGQTVPISFTIHNLEGAPMTYPYSVYVRSPLGRQTPVADGTTTLQDREFQIVTVPYVYKTSSKGSLLVIELPSVKEDIHFAVPRPN